MSLDLESSTTTGLIDLSPSLRRLQDMWSQVVHNSLSLCFTTRGPVREHLTEDESS